MASGGTTSSKPSSPVSMSPITGVLANLFGIGTRVGSGGIKLSSKPESVFNAASTSGGRAGNGALPGATFNPSDFSSIRDLLNPVPLRGFERGTEGVGESALNLFNNEGLGGLRELLSTGFRTDIDPIRQHELKLFREETIPGLSEQFAGQTGTFSTDFLSALSGAGGRLHSELGALQAELDEAASGRRANAFMGGALDIPATFGSNLLTLGEQLRLQQQGATPGGQALALMQALSGVVPTGAIAISPTQKSAQGGVL